jgi:hypothetical protein
MQREYMNISGTTCSVQDLFIRFHTRVPSQLLFMFLWNIGGRIYYSTFFRSLHQLSLTWFGTIFLILRYPAVAKGWELWERIIYVSAHNFQSSWGFCLRYFRPWHTFTVFNKFVSLLLKYSRKSYLHHSHSPMNIYWGLLDEKMLIITLGLRKWWWK